MTVKPKVDYTMRPHIVANIVKTFGCGQPVIDAFANGENARFGRHWGPTGEEPDAFNVSWAAAGLLWVNPPWSEMWRVCDKIVKERPHVILIVPDWRDAAWFGLLKHLRDEEIYFPKGMHLFVDMPAVKWGVWAFLFKSYAKIATLEIKPPTTSAKRRTRLKRQRQGQN